ncbi:MAG TPA: efflux RND transporter periplasmic adaptor subunit [Bacteroidetes bacterium]|nr:efflux RND transporter periplasmic adaptor subunit [Bacteroidota bacterium]
MKTLRFLTMSLLAVILVAATSCKTKQGESTAKLSEEIIKPVTVSTKILKKTTITRKNTYTATLLPFREVNLAPASPGKIEKIVVDVSDKVRKGQVLVFMDRTNLEQAKINLMNLETNFRRLDTLKKTNSIAEQQYDQAKTAYEAAKASYKFLLDNTLLRAPFDGIISGKYFENGEIYSGAPIPTVGKAAVLSLVQINYLKAVVNVEAAYFPVVKKGLKAEITSDIYPGQVYTGTVYRKHPTIDPATKTFTVEIKVPNNNLDLRPGMFARVKLNMGQAKALLIPTIAIIKQIGTNDKYVFVNNRNRAEKRLIKPGRVYDDQTEILKGLREGDELIIEGQNKLMENKPLSIKN